jgi:hypothetical protein
MIAPWLQDGGFRPVSVWLLLLGITLNWWEFDSAEEERRIFGFAVLFPVCVLLVVKLTSKVTSRCLDFAGRRRQKPQIFPMLQKRSDAA